MFCSYRRHVPYLVNIYADLREADETRRETYKCSWLDVVMETRAEEKTSLFEEHSSRNESYQESQVAHLMVRRSPDQNIQLGRRGEKMTVYQLPYKNVLPLPIFVPSKLVVTKDTEHTQTPEQLHAVLERDKMLSTGVCVDKTEVAKITKDMPKVIEPVRFNFRASSLMPALADSVEIGQRSV